jgi:hypothetical protein
MNSPESPDLESCTVKVEIEPNDLPPPGASERFSRLLKKFGAWFGELPLPARVLLGIGGFFLALSTLTAILRLVSLVLSASILGLISIAIYRLAIAPGKNS